MGRGLKLGVVEDIENKISDYLDGDYEIIEIGGIPTIDNIAFGKKAYKTELTTFSIDLRRSSQLLFDHHKQTSGKIHKAFLTATASIIRHYGGQIRDFQGDSILAFWGGFNKPDIQKAVRAAFAIKWMLSTKLKKYFNQYTELDYGIGIDNGDVYIVRAGIKRNPNNNDLVYIGKSVNFAVAIANQAKNPYTIEVSSLVYKNLNDDLYYSVDKLGNKKNMWKDGTVTWNKRKYNTYYTTYNWGF